MKQIMTAILALPVALSAAAAPVVAQTTSPGIATYQAGAVQPLRPPLVVRVPATFALPPPAADGSGTPAERARVSAGIRAERYAQEQAFVKRFGAGRPVRLRAPRY